MVLDAGAVTRLSERSREAASLIMAFREQGLWPPRVPSVVLVECLHGHGSRDARANRLLNTCDVVEAVPHSLARRAARLRRLAGRGSAVDALVVAMAERGGHVLTSDPGDLDALSEHAEDVTIERV